MTKTSINALVSLATVWSIAVVIPGPNFLAIFQTAAAQGRRMAYATALGCGLGTAIWGITGIFGLSMIFILIPLRVWIIRLAGACYLIYVGVTLVFSERGNQIESAQRGLKSSFKSLQRGILTTLSNPKTAAFAASLFSVSVPNGAPAWFPAMALLTILGISFTWYLTVATAASAPTAVASYSRIQRPVRKVAGVLFICFGLKLAIAR